MQLGQAGVRSSCVSLGSDETKMTFKVCPLQRRNVSSMSVRRTELKSLSRWQQTALVEIPNLEKICSMAAEVQEVIHEVKYWLFGILVNQVQCDQLEMSFLPFPVLAPQPEPSGWPPGPRWGSAVVVWSPSWALLHWPWWWGPSPAGLGSHTRSCAVGFPALKHSGTQIKSLVLLAAIYLSVPSKGLWGSTYPNWGSEGQRVSLLCRL